jgi:hypothetical protein
LLQHGSAITHLLDLVARAGDVRGPYVTSHSDTPSESAHRVIALPRGGKIWIGGGRSKCLDDCVVEANDSDAGRELPLVLRIVVAVAMKPAVDRARMAIWDARIDGVSAFVQLMVVIANGPQQISCRRITRVELGGAQPFVQFIHDKPVGPE